jgi:hypothetical protein
VSEVPGRFTLSLIKWSTPSPRCKSRNRIASTRTDRRPPGLNFFRWQAATGVISVLVAQGTPRQLLVIFDIDIVVVTLQLRVYAIYNLDKRIIAFVGLAFVAAIASAITIHIKAFWNATGKCLPSLGF